MEEHAYDEKNITMCKTCKEIYDKNGETDAQIEDVHYIVPLANNKRKREDDTSEDSDSRYDVPSNRNYNDHSYDVPSNRNYNDHSYDVPGYDIRNANELGDPSRNVRLKKEFTGKYAAAPASQLDAFEFDGGKKRRSRRRKTHKKTHKKSHKKRKHNKTRKNRRRRTR